MMEQKRWTVSELTRYLRQLFEKDYRLQDVEVEGEISDFRVPGSGHAYFTLKDADSQLRCVMWRSDLANQVYLPQHGDRVIARGRMSVYEASGQYQLYCQRIQPAGHGDLHAQFERLKAALQAEGLFDAERKRSLPALPQVIGVATSPSTAALQDVLNVLRRRCPLARVVIAPTLVQGDQAPPQIVTALAALNSQPDINVILLVRGGGSLEDLWCFNDEPVARAVADSRIPLIAGVGHEIDFTLADFAADLRAPTPSAAAELATPITVDELAGTVAALKLQVANRLQQTVESRRRVLADAQARLRQTSPRGRIDNLRQRIDGQAGRTRQAVRGSLALKRAALHGAQRTLKGVSPARTLARGYAIVHSADGRVLRDAAESTLGDRLNIQLSRGQLQATVTGQESDHE
jgi:exodeoxyribonuclease VII large subunit